MSGSSPNGMGVYGTSVSNNGVYGHSNSGYAVFGASTAGRGIYGFSVDNYAGFFDGPKTYFGGNVGIGTTSPVDRLEVEGGQISIDGAGGFAALRLRQNNTMIWTFLTAAYSNNDLLLRNETTHVDVIMFENATNNVGIGTAPGGFKLAVNGSAAKPGGGSWSVFSDIRLKDLNGNFERGLDEISKLNPVQYHYKQNNKLGLPSEKEFVGFVAQDVQKVIPEAVEKGNDGYLLVNNDPIMLTMINAIKELKDQNQQLTEQNEQLTKRLDALEKKIQ